MTAWLAWSGKGYAHAFIVEHFPPRIKSARAADPVEADNC
jgi:hypothetical protein